MEEEILKVQDILEILKKRITMIISIILMFTIGAIIISFFILEPKYQTSAKLFIGKQDGDNSSYQNSDVKMYPFNHLVRCFIQDSPGFFGREKCGRRLNLWNGCVKILLNWYNHQQPETITNEGGMTNAQI